MELKQYFAPLRKWWWLIVAATLVATVCSYLAVRQQPFNFMAHTTLAVGTAGQSLNPDNNSVWMAQQLAATYVEIARRGTIQEGTKKALGIDWLPRYTVRQVPNTQLIEIAVTDTEPARAAAVATELAAQLIKLTPMNQEQEMQQRQKFVNDQLDQLEASIQDTKEQILKKQSELTQMFSAREISNSQNEMRALQDKLNSLQSNYAALLANSQRGAVNALSVMEPATVPTQPVGPNKWLTVALAAAIGLALSTLAGYGMEYLDDTLKTPDEVQKQLQLTTLGVVPAIAGVTEKNALQVLSGSGTLATEAYRMLRTNLRFASVDQEVRTLLVTSAAPTEGKSMTAANLAAAMALAGQHVILIDGDLRRPRIHALFGLTNNAGLTSALLDDPAHAETLLQNTSVPGLRVLTSGALPPNPAELLGSVRMRNLLNRLLDQADAVVLDSPPALGLADAAILSTQADGVLLVMEFGKKRGREAARQALASLQRVNARVLGAVINRSPVNGEGYYYYYHHYEKYYRHDANANRERRRVQPGPWTPEREKRPAAAKKTTAAQPPKP